MRSKRYQEAKALIEPKKTYTVDEAVALVKKAAKEKFPASVELHLKLGIDPSKGDQQVRGTIAFPHGTGKTKRVAAFVEPDKETDAKAAGADIIGTEEVIAQIISKGVLDFDVAVATPAMMPKLAKLAKILGPKGLMPNPKTETVGANITKIIKEQKAGKESFKNDNTGNLHTVFGRVTMEDKPLAENLNALLDAVRKLKPSASKGIFIRTAVIKSTMGPGVKIEA